MAWPPSGHRPDRARSTSLDAAVPILFQLLKAEMAEREVRSIAYHMKAAHFLPTRTSPLRLRQRDQRGNSAPTASMRVHRRSAEHCPRRGPGTGKTRVATALGVQVIEHQFRKGPLLRPSNWSMRSSRRKQEAVGQIAEALVRLDLLILMNSDTFRSVLGWSAALPLAEQALA